VWAYFGYTKFFKNYAPYRVDECGDPFHQQPHLDFGRLGVVPTSLNKLKIKVMEKVLDFTGAKGKLTFLDTNLSGTARIMVKLTSEKGEVRETFCSEAVSAELRAGKRTKDSLMFLNVVMNDKQRWIIQRAQGKEIVIEVASLDLKEVVQTTASFEEALGY
jgi:hypothetical protein